MKKCKICKTPLKGRADKRFCSIECKNYYHVSLRKVTKSSAKIIDKTLHRNHSILLEILGKNSIQKKVNRSLLTDKKFNFKYHTHFNINSRGKTYYFLYDIAWMEFSDDEILIVRKR